MLDDIRARGHVRCGVSAGAIGFSVAEKNQEWHGMNADLCRALATAVVGSAGKVVFVAVPSSRRIAALTEREVDILVRQTPRTFSRDLEHRQRFVAPFYHGGHGFLTRKSNGLASALELSGATVCLIAGSGGERAATRFFERHGMKFTAVRSETWSEVRQNYKAKRCLVLAADTVWLAHMREQLSGEGGPHIMLPELIDAEIFGPYVLDHQPRWKRIVQWTIYGLIAAEDVGIKQSNAGAAATSSNPEIRYLAGADGTIGRALGLAPDWLMQVVARIGNYGEIFERHLGRNSRLQLARGRNALVRKGGLMLAPAFR
ncbi:MAG: transporter substrate-binding domain-containing protein [Hyphomicrobiaceae bacterium]|nr:transporter substrate-binding domain-containing protein [Hyphomicrobiaceae bacterium]